LALALRSSPTCSMLVAFALVQRCFCQPIVFLSERLQMSSTSFKKYKKDWEVFDKQIDLGKVKCRGNRQVRGDMAYSALSEKSTEQELQFSEGIIQRNILFKGPSLGSPRPPQWGVERGPGWPAGRVLGNGQVQFGTLICSDMFRLFRVSGCFWPSNIECWNREKSRQEWLGGFWARPDEMSSKRLVRHSGTGHDGTWRDISLDCYDFNYLASWYAWLARFCWLCQTM